VETSVVLKGEGERVVFESGEGEFVGEAVELPDYGAVCAGDVKEGAEVAD